MVGTIFGSLYIMRVAISEWQGRISPVFDAATHLLIADVENERSTGKHTICLCSDGVQSRAQEVASHNVDMLICGAISRPLELALLNVGIEIIPQTCGEVETVLAAFAAGRFNQEAFLMPGCCGERRQHRIVQ